MTLWQQIVRANRPGPPEHSIPFRVASTGAVVVSIAACYHLGELGLAIALATGVATVVGNVFSYRRREHPMALVKPILAVCVVGGFIWFIITATRTATPGDISTVEGPLAILFAWVLSTHAFDVPARKDIAYSLAGSAALMAVAAAQTVDLSLVPYVIAWAAFGLWGLVAQWQTMAGARGVPWRTLAGAAVGVVVLTVVFVAVLPAPHVSTALVFPSSASGDTAVDNPTNLNDGGSSGSLPAHAASPTGRTKVGGYLGFAKSLDTGQRASLGNEVVMRVRASQPTYWIGETFDHWDGQSWTQDANPVSGSNAHKITGGSPFDIPSTADQGSAGGVPTTDIQTFYLAQSGPNLVFHADNATRVYLPTNHLTVTNDGTIVSGSTMGQGTVYTVVSEVSVPTPSELIASTFPVADGVAESALPPAEAQRYLQLPALDPRITALAQQITAGISQPGDADPHTYQKVEAIEQWMSSHVHYSTDIPPLNPGEDAVSSFLFGSRVGYCEQISTATVVMLRSLGIPARETTGYVPGSYNPITDLYDVEAKDAHAWVQVWFPGYGWQNFDPTADVPLANPSPGSVIVHGAITQLKRIPVVPVGLVIVLVAGAVALLRWYRRRPPTWAHRVAAGFERAGARGGIRRLPDETLLRYAGRLARAAPDRHDDVLWAATLVDRHSYGGEEPTAAEIARAVAVAQGLHLPRRRRGRAAPDGADGATGPPGPDGLPAQDLASASASSKDAPAASSGR